MSTKINWFEIPSTDFPRAVKFYERIFDTTLTVEPFGDDKMGLFKQADGECSGCVVDTKGHIPGGSGPLVYLDAGESIDRVLDRIPDAGGKIAVPKTKLPTDMGFIAHFDDSEGNRVALHAMA